MGTQAAHGGWVPPFPHPGAAAFGKANPFGKGGPLGKGNFPFKNPFKGLGGKGPFGGFGKGGQRPDVTEMQR
eukprot:gene33493-23753_t